MGLKFEAFKKFVNQEKRGAALAPHEKGGVKGGKVPLASEFSFDEYAQELKRVCAADGSPIEKAIDKSIVNGLLMGMGEFMADTTIVNADGRDMTGSEWFLSKYKKSRFGQFAAMLDAAAKEKKLKIVRRGVEYQIPKCFASAGHRGRAKINLGSIFGSV